MTSINALTLKLDRARWWSMREQPFYATVAMGLLDTVRPIPEMPTAFTDGVTITWDPHFLETMNDEETRYVILHEALHPAHGHLWRGKGFCHSKEDFEDWNKACDAEIELALRKIPGIKMPGPRTLSNGVKIGQGIICRPDWEKLCAEEIYPLIKAERENGQQHGLDPCGQFTEPAEGKDKEPGEGEPGDGEDSLRDQWERRVIQAAQVAQALGKGDLPADLQRVLERVRVQDIDWRQETAEFVKTAISTRNDWTRSARRHAWQPVIYPRRRADSVGLVVFARDTSGSVSPEMCAEFTAHIMLCLAEINCAGIMLDCDAEIQAEYRLDPGAEPPLTAKGGGGTSHEPVFSRAAQLIEDGEHIAGIVCLTDLATTYPRETPEIPTLWLSTTKDVAPFGRTIHIK